MPQTLPDQAKGIAGLTSKDEVAAFLAAVMAFDIGEIVEVDVDGKLRMRKDIGADAMKCVRHCRMNPDGTVKEIIPYNKEWAATLLVRIHGLTEKDGNQGLHTVKIEGLDGPEA